MLIDLVISFCTVTHKSKIQIIHWRMATTTATIMDDVSWSSVRKLLYPPIERFLQWYEKMSAVKIEIFVPLPAALVYNACGRERVPVFFLRFREPYCRDSRLVLYFLFRPFLTVWILRSVLISQNLKSTLTARGNKRTRGHQYPTGPLRQFSPTSHSELKYRLVLDIT